MMIPEQFKEVLWNSYATIEHISIEAESGRITKEMVQGNQVNEYLRVALTAIALSINLLNEEYFPEVFENLETEEYESYE